MISAWQISQNEAELQGSAVSKSTGHLHKPLAYWVIAPKASAQCPHVNTARKAPRALAHQAGIQSPVPVVQDHAVQ